MALRLMRIAACASLAGGAGGCRMLGAKPDPVGISDVKAVGAGAREWDDGAGGVWRHLAGGKLTWEGAQAICEQLAAVTGNRWRLPSSTELTGARLAGIGTPANKAFGWVHLGATWAADWDTNVNDKAITGGFVDMDTGAFSRAASDDLRHSVACVRTDANGQTWTEADGGRSWWYVPRRMDYETAEVTCAGLAERRHEPWRLPRVEEVRGARVAGIQGTANRAFGRDYLTYVWTGEVAAILDSDEAYSVDVRTGAAVVVDVDEELRIVCVSGGIYGASARPAGKAAPKPAGTSAPKPAAKPPGG